MQRKIPGKLFINNDESDFFTLEDINFVALKKLTVTLLTFLFVFTPIAQAFAASATSTSGTATSTESTSPPSETLNEPIILTPSSPAAEEPDPIITDKDSSEAPIEEPPQPESLMDSSSYDGPINPKENGDNQRMAKTDEHTGGLVYDYNVTVPPGRNGLQPDIKLSYNSQSQEDGSPFGYGWTNSIPYIERLNKTGLNNLYSTSSPLYFSSSLTGELVASSTATSTFASKIDNGDFLNYQYQNNTWTAKDKKGYTYYFGSSPATSTVVSPVELYSSSLFQDSALKGYYRFESNGNDATTTAKNLTLLNSPSFSNGKFGYGMDTGTSNSKGAYISDNMGITGNISLAGWVKLNQTNTTDWWVLLNQTSSANNVQHILVYDYNSGSPRLLFWRAKGGVADAYATYSVTLSVGAWYHLALTYDGTTIRGYVNGSEVTNTTQSGSGVSGFGNFFGVGVYKDMNAQGSWIIDDAVIFSKALSAPEVSGLYSNSATTTESNPSQQNDQANSSHTSKWMLDRVVDTNGNEVDYQYYKDSGQIYPYKITYGGNSTATPLHTVEFVREDRLDNFPSYKSGFAATSNYRVNQIKVSVGSDLVKKYDLTYTTGNNAQRSILQSIQETGYVEGTTTPVTLPATTFTYRTTDAGFSSGGFTLPNNSNLNFEWGDKLADVNGDGLVDYLTNYIKTSAPTTSNFVFIQQANGTWATSTTYSIPVGFYAETCCSVSYGNYIMEDINGDGLVDFAISNDTDGDNIPNTTAVYLNNGSNWVIDNNWNVPSVTAGYGGVDGGTRTGDLNGDGLPDLYRSDSGGATGVFLNLGTTWATTSNASFTPLETHNPNPIKDDFNNDGIIDYLGSEQASNCTATTTLQQYGNGVGGLVLSGAVPPIWFQGNNTYCYPYQRGVVLMDIDGDGIKDMFQGASGGFRDAYQGTGKSWTHRGNWEANVDLVEANHPTYNRIADLNGDGLPDFWAGEALVNQNKKADLLTKITLPTGGYSDIVYTPTPQQRNASSTLASPNLPMVIYTVSNILTKEGNATSSYDSFSYLGGSYYYGSALDRKFAGFSEIDKTDAVGNVTKTFYHQGNSSASTTGEYLDNYWKIGKPYRIEKYDNASRLLEKTINKWDVATTTMGSGFVKLAQTVVSTYEGDASHKDKAESYTYNNSKGNITQKIEYGQVTGSDDGTFSDSGTDNFTTTFTYATSSTSTVMSLLSGQSTVNNGAAKVKEFKLYYDNLTFGKVDKANLTKKEDWKVSSTYINSQKAYNAYGLVTSETDPRGKVTSYTYDTYNLYPITVTKPHSLVSQYTYDYSSGKVATTTDPHSNIFVNTYDGLDRLLLQKQPDPAATSTLQTALSLTYTNIVNSFSVKKSVSLDGSNVVDSYTYLDGLGRKKQERKESESGYTIKDYVYDTRGLLQKETLPYFSAGSATTTATSTTALYVNYFYDALGRLATTTNAVGTTTNGYSDWQVTITDPNGKTKDLYSDAFGNLKQVDEHNSTSTYATTYTYDYLGDLLTLTDAMNNVRNFTYDGLGRRLTAQDLHSSVDGTYGSYTYTHDDSGNMTQKVDPKSQTVNYTYDDINRQLTEDYTGTGGTEVTYVYDTCTQGKGRLCTASTTAMTLTNTYNALGQLSQEVKVISGNSYTTAYTYDRQGNQLTITNPDNSIFKYTYGAGGLIETVQRKESTDGGYIDVVTNFNYSPLEQPSEIEYANGAVTTNTYDPTKLYRLTRKITVLPSEESLLSEEPPLEESLIEEPPLEEILETPVSSSTPASVSSSTPANIPSASTSTLPSVPEVIPAPEATTTPEIIPAEPEPEINTTTPDTLTEPPVSSTTPDTEATTTPISKVQSKGFFSNAYNILASTISKIVNGIVGASHYVYSKLIVIKTAFAAATELYYTSLFTDSNLVSYYRLEGNGTDYKGSNNGTSTAVNYSGGNGYFGQGGGFVTASSSKIDMGNTSSLQITGAISLSFWLKAGNFTGDPKGIVMKHANSGSNISYGVYLDGTSLTFNTCSDAGTTQCFIFYTIVPDTNWHHWVFVFSPNSGSSIHKTYKDGDEVSNTVSLSSFSGTAMYNSSQSFVLGAKSNTGWYHEGAMDDVAVFNRQLTATEIYDLYNGWPEPIDLNIQDIAYTYDANGNITRMFDISITNSYKDLYFTYDDLNRLTNASTTLATTSPFNNSYTYNSIGNMLTRVENGTTTSYTYATSSTTGLMNPHTALKIGTATSTYDNNGNLLGYKVNNATTTVYTWNYNNRLITASSTPTFKATSTYDSYGQRVKYVSGTSSVTTTYYPSKFYNIASTTPGSATSTTVTKHIYANGIPIATIVGTGSSTTVYYNHPDHLGGASAISNSTPALEQTLDYYPYGTTRVDTKAGTFSEKRKFSGHEYDADTGLLYMNARYENPTSGRFISQDPAFLAVGNNGQIKQITGQELQEYLSDPQNLNSYAYARNNPLKYIDPTGEFILLLVPDANKIEGYFVNDAKFYNGPASEQQAIQFRQAVNNWIEAHPNETNALVMLLSRGVSKVGPKGLQPKLNPGPKIMGEKGPQINSLTVGKGTGWRVDVENPKPGVRPGQVHYQDGNNNKYIYDPVKNSFKDAKTGDYLSKSQNKQLLNNTEVTKSINKGLKMLGE